MELGRTVPAAGQALNKDKNIQPRGWLLLCPKVFAAFLENLGHSSLGTIQKQQRKHCHRHDLFATALSAFTVVVC